MTNAQREYAAKALLNTRALLGNEKYLPRVYVVNGKCYFYLNVARRAAYKTPHPIEVMNIEEAWEIDKKTDRSYLNRKLVDWEFDQKGQTFDGNLFRGGSEENILAIRVTNDIIGCGYNVFDIEAKLDMPISTKFLGARAIKLLFEFVQAETYRDIIKFGRKNMLQFRNIGLSTIQQIDNLMEAKGLFRLWNN